MRVARLAVQAGVVADGLAARHVAHLHDARLQFDHRAHRIALRRGRIDAVERDARAHHVAMGGGAEEDAGRIGERGGDAAIEDAHLAECADLAGVERMLRLLGAGEVAHQQRDAVVFGADARRQRGGLVDRDAEPVHAGVDMQRGAAAPLVGRQKASHSASSTMLPITGRARISA